MRTFIFLFCTTVFGFVPGNIYSQKAKIVIEADKVVTVDEVFDIIKKQTNYTFIYQEDLFKNAAKVHLKKGVIEAGNLLKESLSKQDFDFSFTENNAIVIKEAAVVVAPKSTVQQKELKGTVRGESGPLSGASVLVRGTNNATTTNDKGEFTLTNLSDDAVLSITYLGYQKQQVPVKGKSSIDIKLVVEKNDLDEVKIVAYGTSSKRLSSASSTTIKGDELKNIPNSNFASLLQGRVAGLDVSNVSSAPGGGGIATTLRGYGGLVSAQGSGNLGSGLTAEGREFSNPLWVIDGIPLENLQSRLTGTNALSEIDPANIESIEVLKDASAAVLYGSRAANGVILVTTKKGKAGESKLSATFNTSYTYLPEYPTITAGVAARRHKLAALKNFQSAGELFSFDTFTSKYLYPTSYADAYRLTNDPDYSGGAAYDYWWQDGDAGRVPNRVGQLQDSINPHYNNSTNWFKSFFNVGKVTDVNVQASGGGTNFTYNVGTGLYSEKGIVRNSGFDRLSLLANLSFTPTKRTTFSFRTYLAYSTRKRASAASSVTSPDLVERLPRAPFEISPFLPGNGSEFEKQLLNAQDGVKEKNESIRLRTSLALQYRITDALSFSTTNSVDYSGQLVNNFIPSFLNTNGGFTNGLARSTNSTQTAKTLLSENLLSFKKTFNDKHLVDVLVGTTYQHDETNSNIGYGYGSPSDYIEYVRSGFPFYKDFFGSIQQLQGFQSGFEEANLVSYLGRANYSYDRKYNFSASVRRDGSSKFGKAIPYATFPAVSASWNFSEESFMKWIPGLDFGKLRASWGKSGRQFDQPYLSYGVINPGGLFNGNATYQVSDILNDKLSWEETAQTDLGLDADFFNYRLQFVFDYYHRYTDKLLYNVFLPGNTNLLDSQWRNAAAISNQGIELGIKMDLIRSKDLNWNLSVNMARNWNRFEKSFDNRDIGRGYILGKEVNGIYVLNTNGIIIDPSKVPAVYAPDGQLNPLFAESQNRFYTKGDLLFPDLNGDGKIDRGDAVYGGSPLPKLQGGIVNQVTWKNFDLNMVWAYSLGRTVLNGNIPSTIGVSSDNLEKPILADLGQYTFWDPNNPNNPTDFPILKLDTQLNYAPYLDRALQTNVNYMKVKSVVLGYNLSKTLVRKWGISGLRVYVSGENLAILTNYKGLDPESVDPRFGTDGLTNYPLARRMSMGATINF